MLKIIRKTALGVGFGGSLLALGACDPNAVYTGGVYYDSMLWNDYYYGHPRPPGVDRPNPPVRPQPPIARPPIARPPVSPPIHRPPVARPLPGGGGRFR